MGTGASRPSSRAHSAPSHARARRQARKRPSTAKSHGEAKRKERAQSTSTSFTLETGSDPHRTPSPYSDATMESDDVKRTDLLRQSSSRVKSAATSTGGLSRPTTAKSRGGVTVSTQTEVKDAKETTPKKSVKAGAAPEFYRAVRNAMVKEELLDKPPTPAVLAESLRVYRRLNLEPPSDGDGSLYPFPPSTPRSDVIDLQRLADLDDHVCQVPRQLDSCPMFELVQYLVEPTNNEAEIAYVLFRWLTSLKLVNRGTPRKNTEHNDMDNSEDDDEENDEDKEMDEKLEDVTAVVRRLTENRTDHADVFASLCRLSGLECRTVTGVTKDYDSQRADDLFQSRAATWSAVLVEDQWRLVDCLGGALCWKATASDRAQSIRRARLASRRRQEMEESKTEPAPNNAKTSTVKGGPARSSGTEANGHADPKPSSSNAEDARDADGDTDLDVKRHVKSREDTSGGAAHDTTTENKDDTDGDPPTQREAAKSHSGDSGNKATRVSVDDKTDEDEDVFEDTSGPQNGGDDGNWIDEEEVATYQGSTLFKLNTFFFLTDPEQLIFSHFPDDPIWQLLPRSVTLAEFYNLNIPYLKPCFFCLGLQLDTIPEKTNLCNTPIINVSLKFPPGVLRKFSYVLSRGGGVEDARLAKRILNNFLFLETFHRKQQMRITGCLPESGHFFLEIYCKNVLDPSHKAMQHVCTFVFLCTEPVKEVTYYPDNPRAEWGPGADTELLRMLPYSHSTGRVKTADGEAEVTFTISSDLLYVHLLTSLKQSPGEDLNSFAVHRVECGQVLFTVRPPRAGLYALQLYARPVEDSGTVPSVCQYLVECGEAAEESGPPTPFPALPGRRLGPTRYFADLGLSVRSPNTALLRPDISNPLRFQFHTQGQLATNTDFRLYQGLDCEDMREFTHTVQKGKSLSYYLRLPRTGLYHLSLSARPAGASDTPLRVVYHAVVLCGHPQEGVMPFPSFGPAWRHPYVLHRPAGKYVAEESNVSFSCTIPDAKAVAVVEGEGEEMRWQDLHPVQEERGRWEGDVQLEAGSEGHALSLIARLGEGEDYDKMAEFEVKSKAEMEKYTTNRRDLDSPQDTSKDADQNQATAQDDSPEPRAEQDAEKQTSDKDDDEQKEASDLEEEKVQQSEQDRADAKQKVDEDDRKGEDDEKVFKDRDQDAAKIEKKQKTDVNENVRDDQEEGDEKIGKDKKSDAAEKENIHPEKGSESKTGRVHKKTAKQSKSDKKFDKEEEKHDEKKTKSEEQAKDGKTIQSRTSSKPTKVATQKSKTQLSSTSPYAPKKKKEDRQRDSKSGQRAGKSAKAGVKVKPSRRSDETEKRTLSPDKAERGQMSDKDKDGSEKVKGATDQSDVVGSQTEAELTEKMLNGADEDSNDSSSSTSTLSSSDSEAEPIDMRNYHRKRRQEEEAAEMEEIRRLDKRESLLRHRLVSATKKKDRRELKSAISRYRRHVTNGTCQELADAKRMEHVVRLRDELLLEMERGDVEEIRRLLDLIESKGFIPDIQYEVGKARAKVKAMEATPRLSSSPIDSTISPLSEIRRFRHPTEFVHHLLVAGLLVMGVHEGRTKRWRTCQRNIIVTGLRGLYKRRITLRVDEIHPEVAVRARDLLSQLDPEQAANSCAAVLSFYNWVTKVIDEVLEQYDDSGDIVPANRRRQRRIFKEQMKIQEGKRPKPGVLNVIRREESDDDTLTCSDDDDDDDEVEDSPRNYSASDEATTTVEGSKHEMAAEERVSRGRIVTSDKSSRPSSGQGSRHSDDGKSNDSRDTRGRRRSKASSQSASDTSGSDHDVIRRSSERSKSSSSSSSSSSSCSRRS